MMESLTRTLTARQLRGGLSSVVNEALFARGRIGLDRYGQLVAVVIGPDDLFRLERLEKEPGALDAEMTLQQIAHRILERGRRARAEAAAAEQVADEVLR